MAANKVSSYDMWQVAKMVANKVSRKVVKQTVMTTVAVLMHIRYTLDTH